MGVAHARPRLPCTGGGRREGRKGGREGGREEDLIHCVIMMCELPEQTYSRLSSSKDRRKSHFFSPNSIEMPSIVIGFWEGREGGKEDLPS